MNQGHNCNRGTNPHKSAFEEQFPGRLISQWSHRRGRVLTKAHSTNDKAAVHGERRVRSEIIKRIREVQQNIQHFLSNKFQLSGKGRVSRMLSIIVSPSIWDTFPAKNYFITRNSLDSGKPESFHRNTTMFHVSCLQNPSIVEFTTILPYLLTTGNLYKILGLRFPGSDWNCCDRSDISSLQWKFAITTPLSRIHNHKHKSRVVRKVMAKVFIF